MPIDLGDNPDNVIGIPPTPEEKQQIRNSIDLGNVENIALSSWAGNGVLSISSSQVIDFNDAVDNALLDNDYCTLSGVQTLTNKTLEAATITNSLSVTTTNFNYSSQAAVSHRTALKIVISTPYEYSQLVINNQIDEETIYIVTE